LEQCFSNVVNEYQLEKYCVEELSLVEPVEYMLGYDTAGNKESFQYIPLIDVLKLILTNRDIWQQIQQRGESSEEAINDFCDGSIYKSHEFFTSAETLLRIHLYNDEFEVINPLGSNKLIHKVSGFYFVLGNLLPKYRLKLKNIHTVILVRNQLVKKYGYESIVEPLVCDILRLHVEGVEIEINGQLHNIKGTLVTVSADNLTAHALAGFSGSFSNGRVCRYCLCHYKDIAEKNCEEDCVIRSSSVHSYHLQCVENDPSSRSVYGVNGPCHWISHLECLTENFLSDFKQLFPDHFTPKIHFLVHYARLIQEYGAPRSYWCMRFEAKHQYFKKVAHLMNNFKNVCYSFAKRNQMRQCWEWQSESAFGNDSVPQSTSEVCIQKIPKELKTFFEGCLEVAESTLPDSETVWKTKEVVIDTVKYAVGDFFIVDSVHGEEIPQFVKILYILQFRTQWFVCGKLYVTKEFNKHLHSFSVEDSHEWLAFKPGDDLHIALHIALLHHPFKQQST
ncbi:hypothetical protein HHUSO_G7827, partial [Huso huso]